MNVAPGSPRALERTTRIVNSPGHLEREHSKSVARRSRFRLLLNFLIPAALLLGWEVGAIFGMIDRRFFPPPSATTIAAIKLFANGSLLGQIVVTLYRVFAGYLPGALIGVVFGIFTGSYWTADALFRPVLTAMYTVPKLGIFPLMLLIFGLGDLPKIALVGLSVFLLIAITAHDAARAVPSGFIDVGRVFGAKPHHRFLEITLPASATMIFSGLRLAMGQAILVTIATEMVNGDDGVGFLIWHSWSIFEPASMFVGIVTSALVGESSRSVS